MIHLPVLNNALHYSLDKEAYDEEALGFPEPARAESRQRTRLEQLALLLGTLGFVLTTLNIITIATQRVEPSWSGLALGVGILIPATAAFWWARYRHTTPGIKHDDTWFRNVQRRGLVAWIIAIIITAFYVVLSWYDSLQRRGMPSILEAPIRSTDPLALAITGHPADHWFLYGFLYTVLILVMGVRMFMRYRHSRYHIIRTCSVMFFQLGFAFLLPGILRKLNEPDFYFTYFWPLKPHYGWPGHGNTGWIIRSGTLGLPMNAFG